MSIPNDALLLVERLQAILRSAQGRNSVEEATEVLGTLAVSLRSSETRDALSSSTLPRHLAEVLERAKEHVRSSSALIEQTGRAAANLAANCDTARDGLVEADYIANCCDVLERCCEAIDEALTAVKALTVSLLNLVIEGHEKAVAELARHSSSLLKVSTVLFGRLDLEDDSEQILQWTWTMLALILEDCPTIPLLPDIVRPFTLYLECAIPPPVPVLSSAADILDAWCNAEDVDTEAYFPQVIPISDFVEKAVWRGDAADDGEEDEDEDESKAFAGVKGNLINALVGLSSPMPATQADFWSRMESWLAVSQRDDLQCCALLSFGNRARQDASAIQLLSTDFIRPAILRIIQPAITAQVLHSVIGLLRNLAIPEANKVILGQTDLLDKLVEVGVWSTEKDMLGSVQGGAVGIVKNLCRGNARNTVQLASQSEAIQQILDLLERTDDPAIRFEATRVFVNCIRSVSSGATEKDIFSTFEDERIVAALIDLFKDSGPYPVLANESIIALALLVTFGSSATTSKIQTGISGLTERVVDVLAPKEGDEAASKEVRANLVTLLRQIEARDAGIIDAVKVALASASQAGRLLSEEGAAL